jgi:hypothetical protein
VGVSGTPTSRPDLRVGQVWREKRRARSWRIVEITHLDTYDGAVYATVRRNSSRRRQPISEKTLRADYRLDREATA